MNEPTLATRVAADGHRLEYEDGRPFFYLSDTAWTLFCDLDEADTRTLFTDRAEKGFTAVQACVFRDLFEPNTANVAGDRPFASVEDMYAVRMNPAWIDNVVAMTRAAAEHGLIMALLPTWGDKWNAHSNSAGPVIMDAEKGREYCRFLSDALGDCDNVIWVLGGDSPILEQEQAATIRAMAEGIRAGASGKRLVTFYPNGLGSSEIFHSEAWLDFNALQTSHYKPNVPGYTYVERLFRTSPRKPVIDMEPNYEAARMFVFGQRTPHHTFTKGARAFLPQFTAYDVRKSYYRTVLAGAAGFTYGHDSIRQVLRDGDRPHAWDEGGLPDWREALSAPGSSQLVLLKDLLADLGQGRLEPAQELFVPFRQEAAWPDRMAIGLEFAGQTNLDPAAHIRVARDTGGEWVLAYVPVRNIVTLDLSGMDCDRIEVRIIDPESGADQRRFTQDREDRLMLLPDRDLDSLIVIRKA
ncbi:DUF4038 domain-containing protein [Oceaniglobus trochenteri]|uniref:apiosidase-like domain-containing protein n=1 Tax=Oceaniglobus trochenteri TaxID=2763260 RepID=UPI001CFFFC4B|nr:DUF4038 domain-containing protein [Oceaniglobus trochenteri]